MFWELDMVLPPVFKEGCRLWLGFMRALKGCIWRLLMEPKLPCGAFMQLEVVRKSKGEDIYIYIYIYIYI